PDPPRQPGAQMHGNQSQKPQRASLPKPDKQRITGLQETHGDAQDGKQMLPDNQRLGRKKIERRPDQRTPDTRAVPPAGSCAFRDSAEEVNQAKVQLQNPPVESLQVIISSRSVP